MIVRNCAGGVVFAGNKVFILKNDKDQWVLPKGKIRNGSLPTDTAISRIKYETGINANIVSTAGETNYEFFSLSRKQEVYNKIIWYIMETDTSDYNINKDEGFKDGGFYPIDEAIDMITHSQDKSLVSLSYKRYLEIKNDEIDEIYA
ncbi:NUDIX domain-containing protein [Keratinibaculum paraultunense]|uniref:NUDIX domain-containing protein n=1 Tax=Keratinibaculum paraultunense TaxID=1278232 RepID=A0A4R3L3N3_9FIRM|nr:NUDIX hydrolase [Keratinibaculum paraultunense]QQY80511.1 NUDIX hydrolase [Keratinibaculum paraultunense]TCS91233.1 NUDIX domain-containing protein [Keratinibaculum paraultunense]